MDNLYRKRIILLNDGTADQIRAVANQLSYEEYRPHVIFHRSDEQITEYEVLHEVFKQAERISARSQNPHFGEGRSELLNELRMLDENQHTVLVATNMQHFQMCFAYFAGLQNQSMAAAEACILEQPADAPPATWLEIAGEKPTMILAKRISVENAMEQGFDLNPSSDQGSENGKNTEGGLRGLLGTVLRPFFHSHRM